MPSVDALLAVLVKLDPAPPWAEIVKAFGSDPSDAIADAEVAGLVESWDLDAGLTVVLSPIGGARVAVAIPLRGDSSPIPTTDLTQAAGQ